MTTSKRKRVCLATTVLVLLSSALPACRPATTESDSVVAKASLQASETASDRDAARLAALQQEFARGELGRTVDPGLSKRFVSSLLKAKSQFGKVAIHGAECAGPRCRAELEFADLAIEKEMVSALMADRVTRELPSRIDYVRGTPRPGLGLLFYVEGEQARSLPAGTPSVSSMRKGP